MLTFSQPFHQLEHHSTVIQYIKTFRLKCLPQLNNNEFADKTAQIDMKGYNQPITIQKHSYQMNNNSKPSFIVQHIPEENCKCLYTIIWNSWDNYSNQSVDPPPGQLISLNIIVIVGFAVDQPPGQLTPLNIIVIVSLVDCNMVLTNRKYSSVVITININSTPILPMHNITISKSFSYATSVPVKFNLSSSEERIIIVNNVSNKHPSVQPVVVNMPHPIKFYGATHSGVFINP
eukprot:513408_1